MSDYMEPIPTAPTESNENQTNSLAPPGEDITGSGEYASVSRATGQATATQLQAQGGNENTYDYIEPPPQYESLRKEGQAPGAGGQPPLVNQGESTPQGQPYPQQPSVYPQQPLYNYGPNGGAPGYNNPTYSPDPNQNVVVYNPQTQQTTYNPGQPGVYPQGGNTIIIQQQPQVERSSEYSCQLICNLVLGVLVMVMCCNWLCGIPAVILAALGLQSPKKKFRRDMTIGAWVLNIVAIIVLIAIIITLVVIFTSASYTSTYSTYYTYNSYTKYYYSCIDYDYTGDSSTHTRYKTCSGYYKK